MEYASRGELFERICKAVAALVKMRSLIKFFTLFFIFFRDLYIYFYVARCLFYYRLVSFSIFLSMKFQLMDLNLDNQALAII
ncbi:hypothetical protein Syun_027350 [Stephania yunnanensis]|uniref:Uncharacterized protein n=1 Tax=Stephania yunnanensis TaxID=152371 RepID=A0AAP0EPB0_9MAGN